MADPVAEKSGFLRMYMSNHPDTLVAYAKWFGKVKEHIVSAEMSAIDTKGMTLTCTIKGGSKKEVRVPIEPPMTGYDDVKPRLLEMKALAQEGLGMIKAPQITTFTLPAEALKTGIVITALFYLQYFPRNSSSLLFLPAKFINSFAGDLPISIIFYAIMATHALEAIYTFTLCSKHKTGPFVAAGYVLSTLFFGFPIWQDLRKRIQSARIDSVMKVE